jgi:hypothetical protein
MQLLYSSEVWGMFNMTSKLKKSKNDLIYDLYNDHKIEKLNLNLCKSILGVGSKAIIFISLAPQVSGDLNIFNISSSFKI